MPEMNVPTTGTPSPFLYPVHLAIAQKNGTERVVAIDAYRSRPDADLGHELSKPRELIRRRSRGSTVRRSVIPAPAFSAGARKGVS